MAADLVSAGNQSGECRAVAGGGRYHFSADDDTLLPLQRPFRKGYRGIGGQRIICQEIMEAEYESFSFLERKSEFKRTLESGMQSGA